MESDTNINKNKTKPKHQHVIPTISQVEAIIQKSERSREEKIGLVNYLSEFQNFLKTIKTTQPSDTFDLLLKIAKNISLSQYTNEVIFRVGDGGDNFYGIIEGKVAVLIKKEIKAYLNKANYIKHLLKLHSLKEEELLKSTFASNIHLHNKWEIGDELLEFDHTETLKSCYPSIDEFLSMVQCQTTEMYNKKKVGYEEVVGWEYYQVSYLETGKTFGDIAGTTCNSYRTATIVSVDNSKLGVVSKGMYDTAFKEVNEKNRRRNLAFLFRLSLFKDMSIKYFSKDYFNNFREMKIKYGEYIIKEGSPRKEIFIIKNGEIEGSARLNNIYIEEGIAKSKKSLYDYDDTISKVKDRKPSNNNVFARFLSKKVYSTRGFICKTEDIIGFDNGIFRNNGYFCSGKCISDVCELFIIDYTIFQDMCRNKPIGKTNGNHGMKIKFEMITQRGKNIKKNIFDKNQTALVNKFKSNTLLDTVDSVVTDKQKITFTKTRSIKNIKIILSNDNMKSKCNTVEPTGKKETTIQKAKHTKGYSSTINSDSQGDIANPKSFSLGNGMKGSCNSNSNITMKGNEAPRNQRISVIGRYKSNTTKNQVMIPNLGHSKSNMSSVNISRGEDSSVHSNQVIYQRKFNPNNYTSIHKSQPSLDKVGGSTQSTRIGNYPSNTNETRINYERYGNSTRNNKYFLKTDSWKNYKLKNYLIDQIVGNNYEGPKHNKVALNRDGTNCLFGGNIIDFLAVDKVVENGSKDNSLKKRKIRKRTIKTKGLNYGKTRVASVMCLRKTNLMINKQ